MTHRTRRRIVTVALAPAAALAAWAVTRLAGIDLVVSESGGGTATVGPGNVLTAALVAALAGWAVVRLLDRYSRRPRTSWTFLGSTGLAVSVIGPSWLADGASAVTLIALHVVTAVVVIVGFAGTLPRRAHAGEGHVRRPAADPAHTV